jgi:hypothetical protein
MLKAALNVHENVDIGKYNKLTAFLKQQHVGYEAKKSLILSRDEIDKFLLNAPDERFLLIKVRIHLTYVNEVLNFGIICLACGCCRNCWWL